MRRFEYVAGIDLSMTSTGVAVFANSELRTNWLRKLSRVQSKAADWQSGRDAKGKPAATWKDRYVRMENITDRVAMLVPPRALVFMEGPSYGSKGAGTWDRAGLWWQVYEALHVAQQCTVVPVSPSQRMLYATGNGRADKDAVLAAVVKRYPELDITGNDVADAVVFAAMAARVAGWAIESTEPPAKALTALDKLEGIADLRGAYA